MLRFYFSKGSSALAAHILLEEVGAMYQAVEVSIPDGAHLQPDFVRQNPKGRIPVLDTPNGKITENPAILEYIAATHIESGTLPRGEFEQAQARSLAAYLCATVHVAYAHKKRGRRWAENATSLADMQAYAGKNLQSCADYLESTWSTGSWALGKTYSYCDPYLFMLGHWMSVVGTSIRAYPKLSTHYDEMLARPATQKIMTLHGLKGC